MLTATVILVVALIGLLMGCDLSKGCKCTSVTEEQLEDQRRSWWTQNFRIPRVSNSSTRSWTISANPHYGVGLGLKDPEQQATEVQEKLLVPQALKHHRGVLSCGPPPNYPPPKPPVLRLNQVSNGELESEEEDTERVYSVPWDSLSVVSDRAAPRVGSANYLARP